MVVDVVEQMKSILLPSKKLFKKCLFSNHNFSFLGEGRIVSPPKKEAISSNL